MIFEIAYTQKTRARKMGCHVSRFVDTAFITRLFESTTHCIYCFVKLEDFDMKKGKVLDHIRPLKLSGSHTRQNLQVICAHCNNLKRCLLETVFLTRYFYPDLPVGTKYSKGFLYIPIN